MNLHSFNANKLNPSSKIQIKLGLYSKPDHIGMTAITLKLDSSSSKFFKKSEVIYYFSKEELSFLELTKEQREYFKLTIGTMFTFEPYNKTVNIGIYPAIGFDELKEFAKFLETDGIKNSYVYDSKLLSSEEPRSTVISGDYTILDFPGQKAPLAILTSQLLIVPKKQTTCGLFKLTKTNIQHHGREIFFRELLPAPKPRKKVGSVVEVSPAEVTALETPKIKNDEFSNPNLTRAKELLKLLLSKIQEFEQLEQKIQKEFLESEEQLYNSLINTLKLV